MSEKVLNQTICLKQYISEKDYKEINQLERISSLQDKTNLKLELDYKLNMRNKSKFPLKAINEFLYYIENDLIAYLAISDFGGSKVGEINGMVHPKFRRKGVFKKLFELAIDECKKRNFNKLLLLSDGNSHSGIEFIKAFNGKYDFSEYRMKLLNKAPLDNIHSISLRRAKNSDGKEIARQNAIYSNHSEEYECFPEEDEKSNEITYMVELEKSVIGKIRVDYGDNSAFICGFGILPGFRGKGYGKAALKETLHLINERNIYDIELDVECKNDTALNLYKSCGFKERSVIDYYRYDI